MAGRNALKIVQEYFPKVEEVTDARRPVMVEVGPNDGRKVGRKNHRECAMAVACKRAMDIDGMIVSSSTAYAVKGKKAVRFQLPQYLAKEIVSFDRGGTFAPGLYELKKPEHRLGRRGGKSDSRPRKRKIRRNHITADIRVHL